MELKAGDVFCSSYTGDLSKMIRKWQKLLASDNKAKYSHSGIILNPKGDTFEALRRTGRFNLFKRYRGSKVVIARYLKISEEEWENIIEKFILKYEDEIYPYYRFFLNLFPPLAKYINFSKKKLICSELVAKFLYVGFLKYGTTENGVPWPRHEHFYGTNPDRLSDEWHRWKNYKIIFEGIL